MENIQNSIDNIAQQIQSMSIDDQVEWLNKIKLQLHTISPFSKEPTDCVLWVKNENVSANDYNPNAVAPPEMELLRVSISDDWYTQPIVTMEEDWKRIVIDGFHRNRVGKECEDIKQRIHGYLPVVTINTDRTDKWDRMAATVRHNRARWTHKVDSMSDIILELKKRNRSNEKIGSKLWMEADEVLRLAQVSGLAEMFLDREFSEAWEAEDDIIDDTELIS